MHGTLLSHSLEKIHREPARIGYKNTKYNFFDLPYKVTVRYSLVKVFLLKKRWLHERGNHSSSSLLEGVQFWISEFDLSWRYTENESIVISAPL